MANYQLTNKMTGYFDVRVYNERTPRENWKIKGNEDQIAFGVSFDANDPQAAPFAEFAKPYTDRNGNPRVRVAFKIGAKCRWYDGNAQPMERPDNADLDGKPFDACIQYNTLHADPKNPKAARGYWVNQIQVQEVAQNPFSAMAGAPVTATVPPAPPTGEVPPMFPEDELLY